MLAIAEIILALDGEYRPLRLEVEVKQVLSGDKLPLSGGWLEVELGRGEPAHWAHFEAVVKSLEGRPVEITAGGICIVEVLDPQGSDLEKIKKALKKGGLFCQQPVV